MNDLIVKENEELKGLEASKAAQIKAVFEPMVTMLEEFEGQYAEIMALEISPETCLMAKRLRLDIGKIRIQADKVRKEQKEEYLRAGNAIQGVYNILKFAVIDKEEKLEEIEKHYERIITEKIAKIQEERELELQKYDFNGSTLELGQMHESVWANFLNGTKLNYEAIKEAEKKAEQERIEKEKAEKAEQEKIRKENERLKKEAVSRAAEAIRERAEAEAKQKAIEEKARKEREAAEKKAEAERKAHEEQLKKEREARETIERKAAEERAEAERKQKEEAEANRKAATAPDKVKLVVLISHMEVLLKSLKTDKAKQAIKNAQIILMAGIKEI